MAVSLTFYRRCDEFTALMIKINAARIPSPIIMARAPFIFGAIVRLGERQIASKSLHLVRTLSATAHKRYAALPRERNKMTVSLDHFCASNRSTQPGQGHRETAFGRSFVWCQVDCCLRVRSSARRQPQPSSPRRGGGFAAPHATPEGWRGGRGRVWVAGFSRGWNGAWSYG